MATIQCWNCWEVALYYMEVVTKWVSTVIVNISHVIYQSPLLEIQWNLYCKTTPIGYSKCSGARIQFWNILAEFYDRNVCSFRQVVSYCHDLSENYYSTAFRQSIPDLCLCDRLAISLFFLAKLQQPAVSCQIYWPGISTLIGWSCTSWLWPFI